MLPYDLLLAFLKDDNTLLSRLLPNGAPSVLYREVTCALAASERIDPKAHVQFSMATKRVLAYCSEASEVLVSREIRPEHLLLGILKADNALAAGVLKEYGITLNAVLDHMGETWPVPPRRMSRRSPAH